MNPFLSYPSWIRTIDHKSSNVFKRLNATPMDQLEKKQIGRYMRYKLAFDRMDEALQEGWLLEAISLQESIISDRLTSILDAKGETVSIKQSLGRLISHAKKVMTGSGATVDGDFFHELDQWRDARNECVHAFCKLDDHAYAENSAEIFGEQMWETAKKGRELVDLVKHLSHEAKAGRL
ncbi:hypothetical protein [Vulcanococcus sp. Clear-D1]|uniref:hypothetical protein n=1 Tax=Vulcanococcus sp. Clear-D1 TaxID=2766970 RepID=UPI0019919B17|nr:hypothetical protein [Vulcanococcus sp. Clear-D1]MBD1194452.1 hypothetical protein [Vulcanococcus sp. Clear-D1]